ncbi:putative Lactonase, 7-bladed beta-propeller-domain-containing protein [Seiridium cardinale]|uniref:Lactonase, 7-bladed beta-propeller-domain-containing protein n=1 Tax=Seiridium cardinale TaxID=138064 RepID=A0ABR2XK23_9PEZI
MYVRRLESKTRVVVYVLSDLFPPLSKISYTALPLSRYPSILAPLSYLRGRLSQASPAKCDAWYMARNVDLCATVEGLFGLTDALFNVWNLAVASDCLSGSSLDENLQYTLRLPCITSRFTSSSFSTFSIADPAELKPLGNKAFPLSQHGPKPQQDAPHPHQALLDPTGAFILVPDLGADLVRIFKISGLDYTELDPLVVSSGSGPRHATFLATSDNIYMYLVSEIANTITGYDVTYRNSSLHFDELFSIGTHGPDGSVPNGTSAAEITLSPDKRFLIVSSRGENSHTIPNFDTNVTTEIVSDAIISFSIDHSSGELSYLQSFPSGGRVPRQFSINTAGDLVAVGLQSDSRVVVIERDVDTGLLKQFVASAAVAGEVTAVIFNE